MKTRNNKFKIHITPNKKSTFIDDLKQATQSILKKYVMTNDPSITNWGWAIVESANSKVIDLGCIQTVPNNKKLRIRKGDDNVRRVNEIATQLLEIINKYNPQIILSELPHGSQNASGATMIGIVMGILETISIIKIIPVEWYSEGDAKESIFHKKSATKIETILAIDKLYKIPITKGIGRNRKGEVIALWSGTSYLDEAVADAMAIYHVAKQQSEILKYLSK